MKRLPPCQSDACNSTSERGKARCDVLFWIRRALRREGVGEWGWGPTRDK